MKSDLDKHIERHIKDREFKVYFDRADAKRKIAQEIVSLRQTYHITQAQLAKQVKTCQQVISRLENPNDKRIPSFDFLDRVARSFDRKLVISME
ncbi:MAG: helix-turn-helix transcriptional regulator [Proteobacteria bacterium]|nr:helix-turn-helix transcriptional regulator [Pseudomonadota bacterium]